ncbi:MAG: hypothetical protein AB7H93_23210 [Vicinamibacterales bacterium]
MSAVVQVSVVPDRPPTFGAICAGCGAAPDTTSNLALSRLVERPRGRQEAVSVAWPVPHCAACARATKAVFLAQFVPFALGFLVAGGAALAASWYGATVAGLDEVGATNPRTPNSWILAGAAGLAGGIAGGFVGELAARVLLLPVFGSALWRAPLLVPSLFTDADRVAGVTARPDAALATVTLTFDLDDVAAAFVAANHASPSAR